jgi:hypothetical protein
LSAPGSAPPFEPPILGIGIASASARHGIGIDIAIGIAIAYRQRTDSQPSRLSRQYRNGSVGLSRQAHCGQASTAPHWSLTMKHMSLRNGSWPIPRRNDLPPAHSPNPKAGAGLGMGGMSIAAFNRTR